MAHPRRGCVKQYKTNEIGSSSTHETRLAEFFIWRRRKKEGYKIPRDHGGSKRKRKEGGTRKNIAFEPAAAVGGTISIDTFHPLLIAGPMPRYSACHPIPTVVHRVFPSTSPVPALAPIPLAGSPSIPPVAPPPPIPFRTTHDRWAALPA